MSDDIKAFPNEGYKGRYDGMSLRDYFAAAALQGIFASESDDIGYTVTYVDGLGKETYRKESPPLGPDGKEDYSKPMVANKLLRTVEQNQAIAAYRAADAMIIAREKK